LLLLLPHDLRALWLLLAERWVEHGLIKPISLHYGLLTEAELIWPVATEGGLARAAWQVICHFGS
jgi:hypothetical protein